jgi:hypothetical protein
MIVDHVDPAQGGVELDAIEGRGGALQAHHVGQVHVAVALAYQAGGMALRPQRRQGCRLVVKPCLQHHRLIRTHGRGRAFQRRQRHGTARGRLAKLGTRACMRCLLVESCRERRQAIDVGRQNGAGSQQFAEQCASRKAPHAHGVVQDRASSVDFRRKGASGNAGDPQVQGGSQSSIQPHFLLAEVFSGRQCAVVHEGQTQRLLELVNGLA